MVINSSFSGGIVDTLLSAWSGPLLSLTAPDPPLHAAIRSYLISNKSLLDPRLLRGLVRHATSENTNTRETNPVQPCKEIQWLRRTSCIRPPSLLKIKNQFCTTQGGGEKEGCSSRGARGPAVRACATFTTRCNVVSSHSRQTHRVCPQWGLFTSTADDNTRCVLRVKAQKWFQTS